MKKYIAMVLFIMILSGCQGASNAKNILENTQYLNLQDVEKMAIAEIPGTVEKLELRTNETPPIIYVEIKTQDSTYQLRYHAIDGTLLGKSIKTSQSTTIPNDVQESTPNAVEYQPKETVPGDTSNPTYISKEEAERIALQKVGKGTIVKSKFDAADHPGDIADYDIEIRHEMMKYEIEINAINGEIIGYEEEYYD